ncbi:MULTISPECIES: hypothetical protein [unclassified Eisenbergiella]|nr:MULTISPECIES: hypothetical protein [unclassified Eisenbergiella]
MHHPQTAIEQADQLLVAEGGRNAWRGTYEELIKQDKRQPEKR